MAKMFDKQSLFTCQAMIYTIIYGLVRILKSFVTPFNFFGKPVHYTQLDSESLSITYFYLTANDS